MLIAYFFYVCFSIFINKLIHLQGRDCYEDNVRLNKYLHIMQMVYFAMTDNKLFNEDMYESTNGVVLNIIKKF